MIPTSFAVRSTTLKEGLNAGWPICLGYLPIGMAFGVLAQKAGLTPLQIGLMSIMVFAGSAQFIAVAMLAGGIGGRFIPEGALGIDYALIAMFICLLIYQIRKLIHLLTAVMAGLTAVILALIIPGNTHIVIASIAAATVGVMIQRKVMRRNPDNG